MNLLTLLLLATPFLPQTPPAPTVISTYKLDWPGSSDYTPLPANLQMVFAPVLTVKVAVANYVVGTTYIISVRGATTGNGSYSVPSTQWPIGSTTGTLPNGTTAPQASVLTFQLNPGATLIGPPVVTMMQQIGPPVNSVQAGN